MWHQLCFLRSNPFFFFLKYFLKSKYDLVTTSKFIDLEFASNGGLMTKMKNFKQSKQKKASNEQKTDQKNDYKTFRYITGHLHNENCFRCAKPTDSFATINYTCLKTTTTAAATNLALTKWALWWSLTVELGWIMKNVKGWCHRSVLSSSTSAKDSVFIFYASVSRFHLRVLLVAYHT